MSESPLPLNPARILRRAGNILTSNGNVVKEFAEIESNNSQPGSVATVPPGPLKRRSGLGASIRRKFQDFRDRSKLGRSKSFGGADTHSAVTESASSSRTGDDFKRWKGHSRSLTDVTVRPLPPPHSHSAPAEFKRHSTQPRLQTLTSVTEGVTHQEVSSPSTATQDEEKPLNSIGNVKVPLLLQEGTPMTKVSTKKHKQFVFRLDADMGQIVWESHHQKIIPLENIKELRYGADARHHRQQLQLSQEYQDRWLTIIYILDGTWKTLHLIAATKSVALMWDKTLRELHAIRQELMRGLGNLEMREALWEKQYWKGADEESDQKLSFEEVEKLCRRLNINSSREDLERLFMQADTHKRLYLDFEDFRRFVKLLKGRPEIDRLYKKLRSTNNGVFDFNVFEKFMREKQNSTSSQDVLRELFIKYSKSPPSSLDPPLVMTVDCFTSFLLSPDNSAFADQHKETWHDMTRPLPEYFVYSSHNTYLVGHQLVGDSTIEGYIRALLHSCRSVEVDIYDGEIEPMIFHGKTFTSKVSLREVCEAIKKYGFVASPYPIVISAEVHCSLPQQDLIAEIMIKVFGDALVRIPPEEEVSQMKIEELPSPEQLKGKIMLKTKHPQLARRDTGDGEADDLTDPSSSTSDSDVFYDVSHEPSAASPVSAATPMSPATPGKHRRRQSDHMKEQLSKARTNFLQRVRSVRSSQSTTQSSELVLSQSPPTIPIQTPATPLPALTSPLPSAVLKSPTTAADGIGARPKPKISFALVALLVYTVGVKCRGINKKEEYAPEHMFSLSENTANKMLRFGMWDLIKHSKTHMVRIYPKGMRLRSTNYEPHRFWAAGAQLVAINCQTFDLGYMINHAMFQRNGRSGYVLKPAALRQHAPKDLLSKRMLHAFEVTIISAQQLPRLRDSSGREVVDKTIVDPFVEVTLYIPDWPVRPETRLKRGVSRERGKSKERQDPMQAPPSMASGTTSTPGRAVSSRTLAVKKNGFNPVWEEKLSLPFDCVGDMLDLVFVRFAVRQEDKDTDEPLAVYCSSLGSLQHGYRHLPLHDSQLSQYLYSTLFVRLNISDFGPSTY